MPKYYTDVAKRGNKLLVRSVDSDTGKRGFEEVEFEPYIYLRTNDKENAVARGLRDEYLERKNFNSIKDFEAFQETYAGVNGFKLFGGRDVINQYVAEAYKGVVPYKYNQIRGNILDIEVFSGDVIRNAAGDILEITQGRFPKPEDANYPLTAITIYDTTTKTFFALGLEVFKGHRLGTFNHSKDMDKIGNCRVVYKGFDTEEELLMAMMNLIKTMRPDFISGWESERFDIVYMINRVKKVLGDSVAREMSPWGFIRPKTFVNDFGKEEMKYIITGVASLDYKHLVQKHAYVELKNYKLNTAAAYFINETKISMGEAKNLSKLYILDYPKYIQYNIHDVNLVVRMEAKLKFFELVYALTYLCHCNPQDTLGTIAPWSAKTYERLHNEGLEPELKALYQGDTEFIGGYVEEPKPGLYKWVISVDAASLYPHNIMQYNLGAETILSDNDAYQVRMKLVKELDAIDQTPYIRRLKEAIRNGDLINDFYWQELYEFKTLKELNLIMAPNCTFYRRDKISVFAKFCDEVYNDRKKVKKEMLVHEQELVTLKESGVYTQAQIEELEGLISSKHNLQLGLKILMNSLFGAISNRYFREYFDIRVAEAITSAGQNGIQYMSKMLNDYLNMLIGNTGKAIKFTFYNDTDSIYITVDALVNREFSKEEQQDIDRVITFMDKLVNSDIEPKMNEWAEKLADALNCPKNKLFFKREALATAGIWTAKKRYALMVSNNEGVQYAKPKLKFTGLAAKSSSYPDFCRDNLKTCYEIALTKGEDAIHTEVNRIRKEFMDMELHEIATPKPINEMEKWIDDPEQLTFLKGTPSHVKAAINHNRLISIKSLQYEPIKEGTKILQVPLRKGAPYGMETIGFDEYLPTEFNLDKWVDRNASFEKMFLDPLTIFIGAVGWSSEPRASLMDFFD